MTMRSIPLFIIGLTLSACSKGAHRAVNPPAGPSASLNAPLPTATDLTKWQVTPFRATGLKAEVRTLKASEQEKLRRELSEGELGPLSLPGDAVRGFDGALYRLKNSKLHEHEVFIVPKLFVQSGIFGGRVRAFRERTGRMTLQFPVAWVDGLKRELASGFSPLPLPDDYVISDPNLLKDTLNRELGFRPDLRTLPTCPEKMELIFGSERLPVKSLLPQGLCPLNQLFEVAVTGSEEQIRRSTEQAIDLGTAQIRGDFQLSPQFIASIKTLEVDVSHLQNLLYRKFVEFPFGMGAGDYQLYPAQSIRRGVEEILGQLFSQAGLSVLSREEVVPLIDSILLNHFESDLCDSSGEPCFRLRVTPLLPEPTLNFESYDFEKIPQVAAPIEVSAVLKEVSWDRSPFLLSGENTDDSNPPKYGRRGGLLRPIREGDLVELELPALSVFKREYSAPILDPGLSRLDHPVCVRWGEPPTREESDYSVCLEWNTACTRSSTICVREEDYCVSGDRECVERGVGLCVFCCAHVEFVCHQSGRRCAQTQDSCDEWRPTSCKRFGTKRVPTGPAPCLETENQWSKFWRISELPSIVKTAESPAGYDRETLFSGLQIQLTHWEPGETGRFRQVKVTCPLSVFSPETQQEGDRLKIRFRVANHPEAGCEPFNSWNRKEGRESELTLINQLTRPEKYACGFREEFWNGRVVYSCPKLGLTSDQPIFDRYFPRIEIQGVLRLPGVSFRSSSPSSGSSEISKKESP